MGGQREGPDEQAEREGAAGDQQVPSRPGIEEGVGEHEVQSAIPLWITVGATGPENCPSANDFVDALEPYRTFPKGAGRMASLPCDPAALG